MNQSFDYYQLWSSFYQGDSYETDLFFHLLLDPLKLGERYGGPVRIISVFSERRWDGRRMNGGVAIAWSGEEHYDQNVERYDVSLVMRATHHAKRIVCMPLFIIGSYVANLWPVYAVPRPLGEKQNFCLFVVSNPRCSTRNRFMQRLSSRYKKVHSCGTAMNNTGVYAPRSRDAYYGFISQFKFMICFENSNATPEYLTEKLHNAWAGGVIPIYWGASRALEWFNPKAFLYLEEDSEQAMDRLINHIAYLDQNEAAYREMYSQPLLRDGCIPQELSLEHIRAQVGEVLAQARSAGQ